MKTKSGRIIWSIVVLLLLFWAVRWYQRKTVPPTIIFGNAELYQADNKKQFSINDYTGKVLIISFFQTWCRDCARETPVLNQLAAKLPTGNFQVIYVTDEDNPKLDAFRRRLPSDNILFAISSERLAGFGIHVYPTTYLVDKNGKVILAKLEGYNWLEQEETIRKLIRQQL
jgi:thiol-disulfide isomerase/thioredoxin